MQGVYRLTTIHLSLIFGFFKCRPFRVCLAYSSETWLHSNFDMLFLRGSPVKTKQFPRDKINSRMFSKESEGRWQSLLPLPAFSAGESEGGSASRVVPSYFGLLMVFTERSRHHKIPLNSRYHFFDSRHGMSSNMAAHTKLCYNFGNIINI